MEGNKKYSVPFCTAQERCLGTIGGSSSWAGTIRRTGTAAVPPGAWRAGTPLMTGAPGMVSQFPLFLTHTQILGKSQFFQVTSPIGGHNKVVWQPTRSLFGSFHQGNNTKAKLLQVQVNQTAPTATWLTIGLDSVYTWKFPMLYSLNAKWCVEILCPQQYRCRSFCFGKALLRVHH